MKAPQNPIQVLVIAAKDIAANTPSKEAVVSTITGLAKDYPGFLNVEYDINTPGTNHPGVHFLRAHFEGITIVAVEMDIETAVVMLNARMMRHFLKPQEEAA